MVLPSPTDAYHEPWQRAQPGICRRLSQLLSQPQRFERYMGVEYVRFAVLWPLRLGQPRSRACTQLRPPPDRHLIASLVDKHLL